VTQLEQITQSLVAAGLVTPPPHHNNVEAVSETAWRELREKLNTISGKPLSEIIIEDRGEL